MKKKTSHISMNVAIRIYRNFMKMCFFILFSDGIKMFPYAIMY